MMTDQPPSEWNNTFFDLAARCVVGLSSSEVIELVVQHIITLPDQNFYDVLVDFLRNFDVVYFGGNSIPTQIAIDVRKVLVDHMLTTRGWGVSTGAGTCQSKCTLARQSQCCSSTTKCLGRDRNAIYLRKEWIELVRFYLFWIN